ncbi:MAG TPA: T9SS type A sorting domain-containing protein, partial [Prolixibacteraceae bacterium]|nr:T9SS type A sorting domain-containing protein [Prolixibacteraceae bacterium]
DQLPGEPVLENDLMYAFYMRDVEFLQKIDRIETQQFVYNIGCWRLVAGDGCLREMSYFDGLGGPYYSCTGYVGDSEVRKLVYSKKGGSEWGEKLIITSVSDFRKNNNLRVFPNPAQDQVTFQLNNLSETVNVQLINSTGSVVKSVQFNGSFHQLNVTGLKSGIYFYRIKLKGSVVYAGKLTVK